MYSPKTGDEYAGGTAKRDASLAALAQHDGKEIPIGKNVWDPDWLHLFYGLGIAAVTMAIAWAIAQATEARTAAVRRKMMAWLPQSFRAATIHA